MEKSFEQHTAEKKEGGLEVKNLENQIARLVDDARCGKSIGDRWIGWGEEKVGRFIAETYEKLGDQEKAREAWEKEAKRCHLAPDRFGFSNHPDYYGAAEAYEKAGNLVKAKEVWEEVVEFFRDPSESERVALALEKLGRTEEAQKTWERIAKDSEEKGGASDCKIAGEAYIKAGDILKAKEMLEKALKAYLDLFEAPLLSSRKKKATESDTRFLSSLEREINTAAEICQKLSEVIKISESSEGR